MTKHILTVDDSPSVRQMVSFILDNAGYEVTQAGDGQLALQTLASAPFDLVITDINMPGLDGFGLTQEIRRLPQYGKTPVLVLSTERSEEMKRKGRASGATGWIEKPIDPNKLLNLVQRVLD